MVVIETALDDIAEYLKLILLRYVRSTFMEASLAETEHHMVKPLKTMTTRCRNSGMI